MAKFNIEGKEYELKLGYEAIKYLDGLYEGGSLTLIGNAMAGKFDTVTHVIYAGLLHTGKKFSLKTVEKALEKSILEDGEFNLGTAMNLMNDVVVKHPFYSPTVNKLMEKSPEAKKKHSRN